MFILWKTTTKNDEYHRSHKHEIYTETINKIALLSSGDKRIIRPDKINTVAVPF